MAKTDEMVKMFKGVKGCIIVNEVVDDVKAREASKVWRRLNKVLSKTMMKRICFRNDAGDLFSYEFDEDTDSLTRIAFTCKKTKKKATAKKTTKKKATAKKTTKKKATAKKTTKKKTTAKKKKGTTFKTKVVFLNQVKEIKFTSFKTLKKAVSEAFGLERFTINQLYEEELPNGLPDFKKLVELNSRVEIDPKRDVFVSIKPDSGIC